MKFTILFCIVAISCVTDAFFFFNSEENERKSQNERTSLIDSTIEHVLKLKDAVDRTIARAIQGLQRKADLLNEKAQRSVTEIKQKASEITNMNSKQINDVLDQVREYVQAAVTKAEAVGVEVLECKKMVDSLSQMGLNVLTNSSRCIGQKIEESQVLAMKIANKSAVIIEEVMGIGNQSGSCIQDIKDLQQAFGASGCLTKTGAKATWAVAKQMPTITINAVKLFFLLYGLPSSLPLCMSDNAMDTISQEAEKVKDGVIECIEKKIISSKKETEKPQPGNNNSTRVAPKETEKTTKKDETEPKETEKTKKEDATAPKETEKTTKEDVTEPKETEKTIKKDATELKETEKPPKTNATKTEETDSTPKKDATDPKETNEAPKGNSADSKKTEKTSKEDEKTPEETASGPSRTPSAKASFSVDDADNEI